MKEAERNSLIKVIMGAKIDDVNFEEGKLSFKGADLAFKWVFGADGAFSQVREAMILAKGYSKSIIYGGTGYCEVLISSSTLARDVLHYWPRGEFQMLAIPDFIEGKFTGDIFMPMTGKDSFEQLNMDNID